MRDRNRRIEGSSITVSLRSCYDHKVAAFTRLLISTPARTCTNQLRCWAIDGETPKALRNAVVKCEWLQKPA
jgi:hypothetical protein